MAYNDLLDEEGISSQYLVILQPRRLITAAWSNPAGTLYTISFDYGDVVSLTVDGVVSTQASTSALSDGDWFYDFATETISYDDGGTDPSTVSVVPSYALYLGTFDAHYFSDPLDGGSRVVYWEPLVVRAPTVKQSNSDLLFGFLPTQSSSISVSNATSFLQRHAYDSSFNKAAIKLYHYLGDLEPGNIKLLFQGFCAGLDYSYDEISINVFDDNFIFDAEFRNLSGSSFYSTAEFPNCNPSAVGRPIRAVYGVVDNVVPVNIQFGTGNTNKTFVAFNDDGQAASVTTTVRSDIASTNTKIYMASVNGINVGDTLTVGDGGGGFYYIDAAIVDRASFFKSVTHSGTPAPPPGGEAVERAIVGNVTILQDGITYTPNFGRDYTVVQSSSTVQFILDASLETNLSMPRTLSSYDQVFCRCYGPQTTATLGGSGFGSDSAETDNMTNPIVLIYELLKTNLGLSEDQLELADFTALEASITGQYGYAVPAVISSDFPSIRDLISQLLAGELLRLTVNDNGKYTLQETAALGAADKTTDDTELLVDSPSYAFDYSEVASDVLVEYRGSELSPSNQSTGQIFYLTVRSFSETASYLHTVQRQKTFKSPHILEVDAQSLADRIRYIIGDRSGRFSIKVKNRFFDTDIGDVISVAIDKMPGFEYERETPRTRSFRVLEWDKNLNEITLTLDDQKGIEDNSGSF